jgi:hypothetical protein
MQTWLPCGSDNTVEQSTLETSGSLELAGLIKIYPITVHTFRTMHLLGRTKTVVTPQLVSSQLPGCLRFIPHYVKSATRFKSKRKQTQSAWWSYKSILFTRSKQIINHILVKELTSYVILLNIIKNNTVVRILHSLDRAS